MLDLNSSILIISFAFIVFGFHKEDFTITTLSSFFLGYYGVWIISRGFYETNNNLTQFFGILLLSISLYIILRGAYELLKNLRWKGIRGLKGEE